MAFTKMTSDGVSLTNVKAEDVVSGHREKTLQVLWALIHGYQVTVTNLNSPDLACKW